jgi:leader peptidase (prepilin peptidase)/N-methyltransferase
VIRFVIIPVLYILTAIISGWMLDKTVQKQFQVKQTPVNILISITAMLLLMLAFGSTILSVKGFIFSLLLLYAANSDIRTREVSDTVHLMIGITGLIGITIEQVVPMLLGFVLIPLPLFITSIIKKDSIGGADIKLMAASAFLLGLEKGLIALMIGLLLAIVCTIIIRKTKKQGIKEAIPLVPYLSIGCLIAFLI